LAIFNAIFLKNWWWLTFLGHPVYDVHTENRRHINGPGPLRPPAVTSVKRCD